MNTVNAAIKAHEEAINKINERRKGVKHDTPLEFINDLDTQEKAHKQCINTLKKSIPKQ